MSGFITISRRLFSHELWENRREFSPFEAWLDLIQSAAWKDGSVLVNGHSIAIKRGQAQGSLRYFQHRWSWASHNKVKRFLNTLETDGMVKVEGATVTKIITLLNYDSYNSQKSDGTEMDHQTAHEWTTQRHRNGTANGTAKPHELNELGAGAAHPTAHEWTTQRHTNGPPNGTETAQIEINKEKKEIKKENPIAQAGGFDFEKLANAIGRTAARLIQEGNVGQLLPNNKKKQLFKWLSYRHEKGWPTTTTHELFEIVEIFQKQTTEALEASIKKAFASGYKTLVFEAAKEVSSSSMPNFWKLGIEEEHKMTPEQTVKFHRHLLELGWRQEKYQGKTTWLSPPTQTRRTGESTIGQIVTK